MRLFIKIEDGCLLSVYGDDAPEGVEIDVILRDMDNINAGDLDPDPNPSDKTYVYYW